MTDQVKAYILVALALVTLGHWYWVIFTDEVAIAGLALLTLLFTGLTTYLGHFWFIKDHSKRW